MTRERFEYMASVAIIVLVFAFFCYRKGIEVLPGMVGILLLGGCYGYFMGGAAKRRSWSVAKIKLAGLLPCIAMGAVVLQLQLAPRFAKYILSQDMFFLWLVAGFVAQGVAFKVAGIPLSRTGFRETVSTRDLPDTKRQLY